MRPVDIEVISQVISWLKLVILWLYSLHELEAEGAENKVTFGRQFGDFP